MKKRLQLTIHEQLITDAEFVMLKRRFSTLSALVESLLRDEVEKLAVNEIATTETK